MTKQRIQATPEQTRFGRRLRERRLAAGLSQAELAGKRFSHAFVSSIESGRRGASKEAIDYFAQRLGIPVEQLWGDVGPHWVMQMAIDLRDKGHHQESRALLMRTLENLARDREIHPRVLVALHLELGWLDLTKDPANAEAHLRRCLELAAEDDLLLGERAEAHAGLGRLLDERDVNEARRRYREATALLLELLSRSPRFTRLERARRSGSPRSGPRR